MFKTLGISATVVAVALSVGAPAASAGSAHKGAGAKKNIVQTARKAGNFTTLVKAIEAAGLVGTLSAASGGPFTVFAPTDEAFAKLPKGTLESLLADPAALKNILLYHVVSGEYRAADVVKVESVESLNGQKVAVSVEGGVKVNDSNVIATDVLAKNGVIHAIDTVLIPR